MFPHKAAIRFRQTSVGDPGGFSSSAESNPMLPSSRQGRSAQPPDHLFENIDAETPVFALIYPYIYHLFGHPYWLQNRARAHIDPDNQRLEGEKS